MENSSARSANIRVKRYRADETPVDREIRVNIQRKKWRLAQRERMRLRRANESDERRKIRLTAHSQHMADVRSKETESEQSARLEAKRSITGSPGQMNIQKILPMSKIKLHLLMSI